MYNLKPELPDQQRKQMRLKRYFLKTDKSGVHWVALSAMRVIRLSNGSNVVENRLY
jgi:hypothetical protein